MATRELSSVDVQERDDLDRVLDELANLRGMAITIDIASDAEVLASPAEYDALASAAQRFDVQVSISTDDPLRHELATIYGIGVNSAPDAATSILRRRDLQTTVVRRSPTEPPEEPPESLGAALPRAGEEQLLAPKGGAVLDPDASFSFVVAPPTERRPRFSDPPGSVPAGARDAARRRPAASKGAALNASALVVTGIIVAVAIAVLMLGLLAPSASIVLIPETRVVSSQVAYGIAGQGADLDIALQPVKLSETLTFEATVPASGERQVPDEAARGMVFLTNPNARTVVVPAGTALSSLDGSQTFLTVEDIAVPAADPFGAATFGTAVVDVRAVEPGPAGNLDTGGLAGELESGVLYQNRFPLEGGTLRPEVFVTQEDLDGLAAQAELDLRGRVDGALDGLIEPGSLMLGSPETPQAMVATFSAEAGAAVDEVSIQAELLVEGQVYDPAELEAAAEDELERRLGAETPEGFSLLLDSVTHSEPEPVASGPVAYVMRGEATIQAYVSPELEERLAGELAGEDEESARRVLDGVPGLAGYRVNYGPDWLPWEPVPQLADRISVDVDAP